MREIVFVNEQKAVPLQHHIDGDDARALHWVLYTNPSLASAPIPIGTVRLVPAPQYPHPEEGARFEAPAASVPAPDPEVLFNSPLPEYIVDKKTSLHDGIEPYIKPGRLCVMKEYRGKKFADILIQAALNWAKKKDNSELAQGVVGERKWKSLVCVHAQEGAVKTWARNGFVVDRGMGGWFEGGIPHIGWDVFEDGVGVNWVGTHSRVFLVCHRPKVYPGQNVDFASQYLLDAERQPFFSSVESH